MIQHDAATSSVLAPAKVRIMKVVGEVAVRHRPVLRVSYQQSGLPSLCIDVFQRHVRNAVSHDCRAFELLRVRRFLSVSDQPCSLSIDSDA